jgi:hypothetical protein
MKNTLAFFQCESGVIKSKGLIGDLIGNGQEWGRIGKKYKCYTALLDSRILERFELASASSGKELRNGIVGISTLEPPEWFCVNLKAVAPCHSHATLSQFPG